MAVENVATVATVYANTDLGFCIQTGAVFLSAMIAFGALIYNARQVGLLRVQTENAEKLHKTRATVDVVLHEKSDTEYIEARKIYVKLRSSSDSLTKYACATNGDYADENAAILQVLNQYEFMAAGIREGAFDETIYKRMKKNLLMRDWAILKVYVEELRSKHNLNTLYVEFQWLADRWRSESKSA